MGLTILKTTNRLATLMSSLKNLINGLPGLRQLIAERDRYYAAHWLSHQIFKTHGRSVGRTSRVILSIGGARRERQTGVDSMNCEAAANYRPVTCEPHS